VGKETRLWAEVEWDARRRQCQAERWMCHLGLLVQDREGSDLAGGKAGSQCLLSWRGKLLIDQAFSFVFGLLLFLLLSLAATVTRVEGSVALGGFLTDVVAVFRILGVARSWPCPEACYAVVRAGGEDVAKRVPVKGPDSEVVSVLDTVGWVYGLRGRVLRVGGIVWG